MRILLTGANGFIGKYLVGHLLGAGHEVVPAVRRPAETDRLLPKPLSVKADLNRMTTPNDWLPLLEGVDAVINCAGILQGRPGQSIDAIHEVGPKSLFKACQDLGVRRVIQISAISAEPGAGTAYADTKRAADEFLAGLDLDWIVLRPSLVYAEGAYGGTALFRALAALPWFTPLPGNGDQLFQPIHVDDLNAAILQVLDSPEISRQIIDPVGPDQLRLSEILSDLRAWLGLRPAKPIRVPDWALRIALKFGDFQGGPINSTAWKQMAFGNVGPVEAFTRITGVTPRSWKSALLTRPSQAQDRWHAKLYFLRPLARFALAVLWLLSGLVGLFFAGDQVNAYAHSIGIGPITVLLIANATCLLDFLIGLAILVRWRPPLMVGIQLAVVFGYTAVLSWLDPALWLHPFGPLLKNLPILVLIPIWAVLEGDR